MENHGGKSIRESHRICLAVFPRRRSAHIFVCCIAEAGDAHVCHVMQLDEWRRSSLGAIAATRKSATVERAVSDTLECEHCRYSYTTAVSIHISCFENEPREHQSYML